MSEDINNITRKRRFILDLLYPHGHDALATMGLIPADKDVAVMENETARDRNVALFNHPIELRVAAMAGWTMEAMDAVGNPGGIRLLREFTRAMLASLVDEGLVLIPILPITEIPSEEAP